MDSGFKCLDSGFLSVELGFRIPIVIGIPDFLGCTPDSKLRIPDFTSKMPKIYRILESGFFFYVRRYQLVQFIGKKSVSMNLMHLFSEWLR